MEDANQAASFQVRFARETGDLPLLSEIAREAEECGWDELRANALLELEKVSLPVLLHHCKEHDALAYTAIYEYAMSKDIRDVAKQAQILLKSSFDGPRYEDEDPELRDEMQLLMDETYTAWGGHGRATCTRDRIDLVAERLEVDHVVVLSNSKTYLKYLIRQQVIEREMPQSAQTDWSVRTDCSSPSRDGRMERRLLKALGSLRRDLNECYLWHGTGPNQVQNISKTGFDLQQAGSGRGSLFGRGLYFAESCLKADEYAKKDQKELFPLILCRVTLGNVNYCDVEDPVAIRESLRCSCRASTDFYHSVLGDREKTRKTFREFVVFDESQVFPEYIVWYRRK